MLLQIRGRFLAKRQVIKFEFEPSTREASLEAMQCVATWTPFSWAEGVCLGVL